MIGKDAGGATSPVREMTWGGIWDEFGPLTEIPPAPDGRWNRHAIEAARRSNLLWTRVDPGLLASGYHFVNRQEYFVATRPYSASDDIVEVDPDIAICATCGTDWFDVGDTCPECGGVLE